MIYETNQRHHHDLCSTFRLLTSGERVLDQQTSEHPGWELTYMPRSSGHDSAMQIRGRTFHYTPDSLLLYNGNEVHTEMYSASSTATHRVDALVLHPGFLEPLFAEAGVSASELLFEQVKIKATPRMRALLATIFALRNLPGASKFSFDCLATEIAAELALTQKNTFSEKLKARLGTGHFPSTMAKAKRAISERALDPTLRLSDISAAAGLSKFHLIRSFRQHTGTTPRRYLANLRLDIARQRLAQGSSVTDAALASGFYSLSTFEKARRVHARAIAH